MREKNFCPISFLFRKESSVTRDETIAHSERNRSTPTAMVKGSIEKELTPKKRMNPFFGIFTAQ